MGERVVRGGQVADRAGDGVDARDVLAARAAGADRAAGDAGGGRVLGERVAGDRVAEGRVVGAVHLGVRGGVDRQGGPGDGKRHARGERDVVVGRGKIANADGIRPAGDGLAHDTRQRAREGVADRLAVLQCRGRVRQRRVGRTVDLGLAPVRRHGDRGLRHILGARQGPDGGVVGGVSAVVSGDRVAASRDRGCDELGDAGNHRHRAAEVGAVKLELDGARGRAANAGDCGGQGDRVAVRRGRVGRGHGHAGAGIDRPGVAGLGARVAGQVDRLHNKRVRGRAEQAVRSRAGAGAEGTQVQLALRVVHAGDHAARSGVVGAEREARAA